MTRKYNSYRRAEEVLEEYALIREGVDSIRQAAERMGMTHSALDMALSRARKRGDRRALAPPGQLMRSLVYRNPPRLLNRRSAA